jgi:outer membrane lipoprotein-sorting protein
MNCAKSKELMVAYIEGLLDEKNKQSVAEHLKDCASCRTELKEINNLRDRLVKNGKVLARGDVEDAVLDRIIREQNVRLKTATTMSAGLKIRRIIMRSPITKLAAAAVIVIAVVLGVSQFIGGTVTFAEVIKPILNARTVVFDFIVGEEETGTVIHDIVAGSRIRRTFSNTDNILMIDLDEAKMLVLDSKSKSAAYIDIKGPIQEGTKSILEFVRNVVTKLEENPNIAVQELGQKEIDGREAVGFLVDDQGGKLTIWADAETVLPIRIEMLLGQSFMGQTHYVLKNFEFDAPVDESLVSMDIPAGYTLSDQKLDMSKCTEEDFVTTLRIWVEHFLGGSFPESMSVEDLMKFVGQAGGKIDTLAVSEQEKMQLGMALGRGFVFFQQMDPQGIDWHYAGGGAKLGEANKAIFWYQPKGSETYRVIYGDLHVEDVESDQLPK